MENLTFLLKRTYQNKDKTLGTLYLQDANNEIVFMCRTLELPWRNNERKVSCIPAGTYQIVHHNSPKFGWSLWLQEVPGRTGILIHKGNYTRDILGCILPGLYHDDIDKDGIKDVVHSTVCVDALKHYTQNSKATIITITDPK